ncbi:MAG: hypothetical protein ACREQM_01985 [Candidatus Dormibacteraceae bacterium]
MKPKNWISEIGIKPDMTRPIEEPMMAPPGQGCHDALGADFVDQILPSAEDGSQAAHVDPEQRHPLVGPHVFHEAVVDGLDDVPLSHRCAGPPGTRG